MKRIFIKTTPIFFFSGISNSTYPQSSTKNTEIIFCIPYAIKHAASITLKNSYRKIPYLSYEYNQRADNYLNFNNVYGSWHTIEENFHKRNRFTFHPINTNIKCGTPIAHHRFFIKYNNIGTLNYDFYSWLFLNTNLENFNLSFGNTLAYFYLEKSIIDNRNFYFKTSENRYIDVSNNRYLGAYRTCTKGEFLIEPIN